MRHEPMHRVMPNALGLVGSPSAHGIVRVKSLAANGSKEICKTKSARVSFLYTVLFTSPTLTHSATFGVRKATSQADVETIRQLVNNGACLQIAVGVRVRRIPQVHPAPTVLPIWRDHEVRVIESKSILDICDDGVSFRSTTSKIMLPEMARNFFEAITKYHNTLGHIEVNTTIRTRTGNEYHFRRILIEVRTLLPNVVV